MAHDFVTGQHLLAVPELKRYVLVNTFDQTEHLVTDAQLRDAFLNEYTRIMANRHPAWFVYEYYE